MPATAHRHQHRHFKTLIVLVLAMTGGTFLLFWIAQITPITPLRASVNNWTHISVRAAEGRSTAGFYHYRIDEVGRLFRNQSWNAETGDDRPGKTIVVVLTCPNGDQRVSSAQAGTLTHLLSELRHRHGIPADRVRVEPPAGTARRPGALPRPRRT